MRESAFPDGLFPARQEAALTREEENIVKARLFALLGRQARLRTQGDHSSLREEDAAELLWSLLFSLRFHLRNHGLPLRALLTADLADMLTQAQAALFACLEDAKALYQSALLRVVTFGSRSLTDTLKGIGQFFRSYDVRLYAHQIPASIDYQLSLPVPDELQGVLYVQAYLERLLIENALIGRFSPARVKALLCRALPEYRELLVNLYEPVAAVAVGLELLGGWGEELEISRAQAARIHRLLAPLPPEAARGQLTAAAEDACRRYSATDAQAIAYLSQTAEALYPRIILSPQSAAGAFFAR